MILVPLFEPENNVKVFRLVISKGNSIKSLRTYEVILSQIVEKRIYVFSIRENLLLFS